LNAQSREIRKSQLAGYDVQTGKNMDIYRTLETVRLKTLRPDLLLPTKCSDVVFSIASDSGDFWFDQPGGWLFDNCR
jgi:hypothetical protein